MICNRCNKEADGVHTCNPVYTILKIRWENCSGCNFMKPIYEEIKKNNTREDIDFQDLKMEDDMELVGYLKVRSIPTIIVWKHKVEVGRKSWVITPIELTEWIYSLTTNSWTLTKE